MDAPLRYGIIGSGMMGIEHLLNLRLIPEAQVVAVADPHPTSLTWARDTAGPEVALYEDHRELLARAPVDVIVVATPNHTHRSILADVLPTGRHVLVEKPLCTTVADCLAVEEAAAGYPGVLWVGMQYRYMPPVARLIEEVRAGSVGSLRMLAIREHRFPFLPKVGDWNRFARNTGGTLVEKCCHFFDLMRWVTGRRPERVYASGGMDVNHLDEVYDGQRPDILDNAFVVVDFEGGVRALLDLCMFAEGSRNQEEISAVGDAGKVECFVPESTLVVGRRSPRKVETLRVDVEKRVLEAGFHHGATYFEHRAFLDAIVQGRPAAVGVHDGAMAVAMGVAAERSATERRPVELAEVGVPGRWK